MFLLSWLKGLGKLIVKGLGHARDLGLNDELMMKALALVKAAAGTTNTNDQKREWAVRALMVSGVPQPLARLAVELAVITYKAAKK